MPPLPIPYLPQSTAHNTQHQTQTHKTQTHRNHNCNRDRDRTQVKWAEVLSMMRACYAAAIFFFVFGIFCNFGLFLFYLNYR